MCREITVCFPWSCCHEGVDTGHWSLSTGQGQTGNGCEERDGEEFLCLHHFLSAVVGPEERLTDSSKDIGESSNNLYSLSTHLHQIVVLSLYISLSLLTSLHEDSKPKRYFHNHERCRIIMIHVGSPDTLNHFQACSIESAAFHHPQHNVCLALHVTDENYEFSSVLKRMKNIDNLKIFPVDVDTLVGKTYQSSLSLPFTVAIVRVEPCQGSVQNTGRGNQILYLEPYPPVQDNEVRMTVMSSCPMFAWQTLLAVEIRRSVPRHRYPHTGGCPLQRPGLLCLSPEPQPCPLLLELSGAAQQVS